MCVGECVCVAEEFPRFGKGNKVRKGRWRERAPSKGIEGNRRGTERKGKESKTGSMRSNRIRRKGNEFKGNSKGGKRE
jgi:hypothetical protein